MVIYGLTFDVLMLVVALRLLLGEKTDYDERQTADQGMAAKYALWTFLGLSAVRMFYGMLGYEQFLKTEMTLLIGCVVVLLVYLTIVIVRDAYVPANFGGFHWLLLLFAAVGFASFWYKIYMGELDWTGQDIRGWTGLACGIVMVWSGLLVLGKHVMAQFEKE